MSSITVLTETASSVEGTWKDGRPLVSAQDLDRLLGWTLKPEGLCKDDACIPVHDRDALVVDDHIDLTVAASLVGRNTAVDADAGMVAVGMPNASRAAALKDREAPDFTLPDISGKPQQFWSWQDKKKLVVAFSSW